MRRLSNFVAGAAAVATAAAVAVALSFSGCANDNAAAFPDSGTSGPNAAECPVCVTDQDCNGGSCAQFGSDIFCAPTCPNGNECASDRTCQVETSATGEQVSVCTPNDNACGVDQGDDAGPSGCNQGTTTTDAGDPNQCGTLIGPAESASCSSCTSSTSSCQANGCYGGWWCDSSTSKCRAAPTNCGGGSGGGGGVNCAFDAGSAPITGNVGKTGGTASRLYFAVIGDTRPADPDRTDEYPTAIITKIYADVAALNPQPLFAVTSGDYMFATPGKGNAAPQLSLYLTAQSQFKQIGFPAMGNHECTGATASNCATTTTENFDAFMSQMLAPLGQTKPYYVINVNATDNSWTSKFVFIAANAWDATQSSWLDNTLGQNTTYTFIIRHEPVSGNTAPGVTPSEAIMANHPYTLAIVGHTHSYGHYSDTPRQMLVGNGGAPPTGSKDYGFGVVIQRPDGTIQADVLDYQSLNFDPYFRFAVKPDGSPAAL
ncbi:MAG: hypothetical protein ABI183_11175 [Polyangiaceae bacterium]